MFYIYPRPHLCNISSRGILHLIQLHTSMLNHTLTRSLNSRCAQISDFNCILYVCMMVFQSSDSTSRKIKQCPYLVAGARRYARLLAIEGATYG